MMLENEPIAALRLTIASPTQIRAWSSGEVTLPETINYLTEKPEPDGLFCERIFGPTADWTCACDKYRRERTPGFVCEVCGVKITTSSVRRERMGHIELAAPVAHPWFARHAPSITALLLGLSQRKLTSVLSYTCYLVLAIDEAKREQALAEKREGSENEPHHPCLVRLLSELAEGDVLDEITFGQLSRRYGDVFRAGKGAEALRERLASLNLDTLSASLRQEIERGGAREKKTIKRLHIVEAFRASGVDPSWMIFSVLPVLPPELRPLVRLDGGRFASSDLNVLFERVISRNNRLKRFLALKAPEVMLNNEKRLLQEACDALLDNGHRERPLTGSATQESGQRIAPSLPVTPIPPVLSNASESQGSPQPTRQEAEGEEASPDLLAEPAQEQLPDGTSAGLRLAPTSAPEDLEHPIEGTLPDAAQTPFYVAITVLKELSLTLHMPDRKRFRVPLHLNAKETQLIAYLAWLDAQSKGQTISLDKLREHIFGYGRADEDATPKKLQDALDSSKKEIRRQLRQAVQQVNQEVGEEVIPPNLDIFAIRNKRYGLSDICHVVDLALIDAQHQIIQQAFDDGLLADSIPETIKQACDRLRKAYVGDFLADLLHESPEEAGAWVRRPFTLYRDYFLQAVLYAAEYELRAGQELADEYLDDEGKAAEEQRRRQRAHYSRAAQLYRTYAMRACDSRFDLKVTFGGSGRAHGERVDMSERTLRCCITLYGILGSTHMVNQVYSAYYKLMKTISAKAWEPSKETLQDLQGAQAQTNAYRFPARVMSHEPLPPHLETDGSS